jgi:hypothetical protein
MVDLVKLLIILLTTTHIFASMFHGLALVEISFLGRTDTWLYYSDLLDEGILVRYINAFYFIEVTMSSSKTKLYSLF